MEERRKYVFLYSETSGTCVISAVIMASNYYFIIYPTIETKTLAGNAAACFCSEERIEIKNGWVNYGRDK